LFSPKPALDHCRQTFLPPCTVSLLSFPCIDHIPYLASCCCLQVAGVASPYVAAHPCAGRLDETKGGAQGPREGDGGQGYAHLQVLGEPRLSGSVSRLAAARGQLRFLGTDRDDFCTLRVSARLLALTRCRELAAGLTTPPSTTTHPHNPTGSTHTSTKPYYATSHSLARSPPLGNHPQTGWPLPPLAAMDKPPQPPKGCGGLVPRGVPWAAAGFLMGA
jgi:hypothetical protein